MNGPGFLADLSDEGMAAWRRTARQCFDAVMPDSLERCVVASADEGMDGVGEVDWTAMPVRVARCLGRSVALELLDWRGPSGHEGRVRLQEEYAEWRVVRDRGRTASRFELTTELREYWEVLAAYEPSVVLNLIATFAGEARVHSDLVYGDMDPLASGITPDERRRAFVQTFLNSGIPSPYNSGERAICCAVQPSNSLSALFKLVGAAAVYRQCRDASSGRLRCLSAGEAIALFPGGAQQARGSDPVLVERVGRLAFERRLIAFDDPVGVYVVGFERARLRTPDGSVPPADWFTFSRGRGPEANEDGRARYQRLAIEIPDGAGFGLGDLVDVATAQRIAWGGQLADMTQVAVYLRVGPSGSANGEEGPLVELEAPDEGLVGCSEVRKHHAAFEASDG